MAAGEQLRRRAGCRSDGRGVAAASACGAQHRGAHGTEGAWSMVRQAEMKHAARGVGSTRCGCRRRATWQATESKA